MLALTCLVSCRRDIGFVMVVLALRLSPSRPRNDHVTGIRALGAVRTCAAAGRTAGQTVEALVPVGPAASARADLYLPSMARGSSVVLTEQPGCQSLRPGVPPTGLPSVFHGSSQLLDRRKETVLRNHATNEFRSMASRHYPAGRESGLA